MKCSVRPLRLTPEAARTILTVLPNRLRLSCCHLVWRAVPRALVGAVVFGNTALKAEEAPTAPPPLGPKDQYNPAPLLSYQELGLSLGVLVFGLVIVLIEYRLLLAVKSSADEVIRALIVTLIIVVSLTLVASGYGKDQITPVLALFGTIVGYLLGSGNKRDKNE